MPCSLEFKKIAALSGSELRNLAYSQELRDTYRSGMVAQSFNALR